MIIKMLKKKEIGRNRIKAVGYMGIETKQSHDKRIQQISAKRLDMIGEECHLLGIVQEV